MKVLALFLLLFIGLGANAANIEFRWDHATERENGTLIDGEKKYVLKYSVNNVARPLIEIDGSLDNYSLLNVEAGNYVAQMATQEDGLTGAYSDPVSITIVEDLEVSNPKSPTTITVDLTDCEGGCVLEVIK